MLPDLLAPGLKVVICGSAVSTKSRMKAAYYAGPGNRFWRTLAEVGLTPIQLAPEDYPRLLAFGIGLTDLIKTQSGTDAEVRFAEVDRGRLTDAVAHWKPSYVCFNGKRAAQEYFQSKTINYGVQPHVLGTTRVFVAPSTSAAARGAWDLSLWQDLAKLSGAA